LVGKNGWHLEKAHAFNFFPGTERCFPVSIIYLHMVVINFYILIVNIFCDLHDMYCIMSYLTKTQDSWSILMKMSIVMGKMYSILLIVENLASINEPLLLRPE
jgi:hypothetical protein